MKTITTYQADDGSIWATPGEARSRDMEIGRRRPDWRRLVERLKTVRRDASMESCCFDRIWVGEGALPYPTNEKEVQAFILERTKPWRDSWLVGPIDEIIESIERWLDSPMGRREETDR